jgi:hypothetical protein
MLSISRAREELRRDGVPEPTIDGFFESFKANPEIWHLFERYALEAIHAKRKVGAKAIMERVRWESEVERGKEFKVSNSWTAYYARIFAIKHPAFRSYFDFKTIKGVTA